MARHPSFFLTAPWTTRVDNDTWINYLTSVYTTNSSSSGSHVTGRATESSDCDLCVVSPGKHPYDAWRLVVRGLPARPWPYDVRVFEELPVYIQGHVMDEGIVVSSPDEGALYEYFFFGARKRWDDYQFRVKYPV